MVTNGVTVRKHDGRTFLYDQDMWNKLLVTLIHHRRRGRGALFPGFALFDEDDNLGYWRAIGINHDYIYRLGLQNSTTHHRQQQGHSRSCQPVNLTSHHSLAAPDFGSDTSL